MPTCSTDSHYRPHPASPSPDLAAALAAVDETARQHPDAPPVLISLREQQPKPALAVRHLEEGAHPMQALLGFIAPSHWVALGCMARGTIRSLPPQPGAPARPDRRPPAVPPGSRVRLGILIARDAGWATLTTALDKSAGLDCRPLDTSPPQGQLADACRRALGLPTRPPPVPPVGWWASSWLDRLFAEAALRPHWSPSWSEAVELHPLAGLHRGPHRHPDDFAEAVAHSPPGASWETLRHAVIAGESPLDDVTPDLAAWMDEGMFSRWLLEAQLPASQLFADLGALLPAETVAAVGNAITRWGPV